MSVQSLIYLGGSCCGIICSANELIVWVFDDELVDEIGNADEDQDTVDEIRRDGYFAEGLLLMHHVNDAGQEKHVDHRTEASTVSNYISDLEQNKHQEHQ